MLVAAAILIVLVAAMHSLIGGKRLIRPILKTDGLPIILGSLQNTKLTLSIGWRMLSLCWIGVAAALVSLQIHQNISGTRLFWIVTFLFGVSAALALIVSKGAYKSWVFFRQQVS